MSFESGYPGAENHPPQQSLPPSEQSATVSPPPPAFPPETSAPYAPPTYGQQAANVPAPYTPPAYPPPSAGPAGYPYPQQPGQQMIAPKNPALGLIISFFIPGVGSMVNGSVSRGVIILVGYCIAWLFTLVIIGIPFLIGFWIWGMVDGYLSAQRWNQAHGIIS